jgi:hypothetical protein
MKHENQNIEVLLNSFIDGELTEREETKVQRLISHDAQVAQRLRELQKSKMLVSSLPRAEAPARILDGVKASLETEVLSDERAWNEEPSGGRVGVRHLMVRKFLAAAAMIGLVAILGGVVYTIVAPETHPVAPVPVAFDGRLELKTDALSTVNAFISKVIEDKGLSNSIMIENQGGKRVYSLTCSQEDLNLLLANLSGVWESFNSTTLFVNMPGEKEFDDVSTERIITIVDDLMPVKPDLTGRDDKDANTISQQKTKKQIRLSIVVADSD